mmetsp:Transcript_27382/g.76586  ORF Transcript_27382/g.76586 Transcript_27382/m.76586 type:complete len:723 (-) Transcript_27382:940-3108(-)
MHPLGGRGVREAQAGDRDHPLGRHHLPLRGPGALERQRGEHVRADNALQHHDLLLLQRAQQRAPSLPDEVHAVLHRRGLRREWRGDRRVTWPHHGQPPGGRLALQLLLHILHLFLHVCWRARPVVDVAMGLVVLLQRSLELSLVPDEGRLHRPHLRHHAPVAPLGPGLHLRLQPLFLFRLQLLLLLPGEGFPGLYGLLCPLLQRLRTLAQHGLRVLLLAADLRDGLAALRLVRRLRGVRVAVAGEQSEAHVGLLERAHVVTPIAAHERELALLLELANNGGLTLRRHAREHLDLVDADPELGASLRGRVQRVSGDYQGELLGQPVDVLCERQLLSPALAGCHHPVGGRLASARPLPRRQQQPGAIALRDAAGARHVQGSQRGVPGDHGDLVVRLAQRPDDERGVCPRPALEADEAGEAEASLHLLSRGLAAVVPAVVHPAVRKREYSQPSLGKLDVAPLEPRGHGALRQQRAQGLRRALHEAVEPRPALEAGGLPRHPHFCHHRHALQGRGEVEPVLDVRRCHRRATALVRQRLPVCAGLRHLGLGVVGPPDPLQRRDLDGIPRQRTVQVDERVTRRQDQGGGGARGGHLGLRRGGGRGLLRRAAVHGQRRQQGVRGQCASLVEQAVRQLAGERHSVGLGAIHSGAHQRHQRRVHRQRHLHGQVAGHDHRQDENAPQDELVRCLLALRQSLLQHVPGGHQRKREQDQQSHEGLLRVSGHLLL